jgi:hypothetical protein
LETQTAEANVDTTTPQKRKGRPAGSKNLKKNAGQENAVNGVITAAAIDHTSNGQTDAVQLAPKKIIKRRARKQARKNGALETASAVNGHAKQETSGTPNGVIWGSEIKIAYELGEFAGALGRIKNLMPVPELRTFVAGYLTA